jgi:hypothetical protein
MGGHGMRPDVKQTIIRARLGFNPEKAVGQHRRWLLRCNLGDTAFAVDRPCNYVAAALIWLIPDKRSENVVPRNGV